MRISQLLESSMSIEEELRQEKYKDYSQGIERLLNGDWPITRGSNHYSPNKIDINKPRTDRKPANASTYFYHYAFKYYKPWINLPPRSVICIDVPKERSDFGRNFFIIPKNGSTICLLPSKDLWLSFKPEKYFGKQNSGKYLESIAAKLQNIVASLTSLPLTQKNFLEMIDMASEMVKEDDSILSRFNFSLEENNTLENAIQEYFEDVDIEISNVQDVTGFKEREVWFSNDYLTIPYNMVNER